LAQDVNDLKALREAKGVKAKLREIHGKLLPSLTAGDPVVGKAYSLGRALADLYLRPGSPTDADPLPAMSPGRLGTIRGWLRELQSALPDHAVRAVLGTLDQWQLWLRDHRTQSGKSTVNQADHRVVLRAVRAQGRIWRSLLSGETRADDMLDARDYIGAGNELLSRYRRLGWGFLRRYWPVIAGVSAAAAVATTLALTFSKGTAAVIATIVAILSALGITGKTATSTLGRVANGMKDSLWGAEVDIAVGVAATRLPDTEVKPNRLSRDQLDELAKERAAAVSADQLASGPRKEATPVGDALKSGR
jgi:hypothetical protein